MTNFTRLVVPDSENEYIRTQNTAFYPARDKPVFGRVQGNELEQYDYTPQQYNALARLVAALIEIFPAIELRYPTNADGSLHEFALPPNTLKVCLVPPSLSICSAVAAVSLRRLAASSATSTWRISAWTPARRSILRGCSKR